MLPSPDFSPEPTVRPENTPMAGYPPKAAGAPEARSGEHPADSVNLELGRMVVRMHDTIMGELQAERQQNKLLRVQQQQLQGKMDAVEQRLQTHLFLMEGFVSFMAQVREGAFRIPQNVEDREVQIAGALELEREPETLPEPGLAPELLAAARGAMAFLEPAPLPDLESSFPEESLPALELASSSKSGQPVEPAPYPEPASSLEPDRQRPTIEIDVPQIVRQVEKAYTFTPTPILAQHRDDFDMLPPTPNFDTSPIRSTGLRAAKRKNPNTTTPERPVKRRRGGPRRAAQTIPPADTASDGEYCPSRTGPRTQKSASEPIQQLPGENDGSLMQLDVSDPKSQRTPRLRNRVGWRAVNDLPLSPVAEVPERRLRTRTERRIANDLTSPVVQTPVEDAGSDYNPESSDDENSPPPSPTFSTSSLSDLPSTTPSRAPSPATPTTATEATNKPRYSAPRQTGIRYASGPPDRPFKYLRMSKTVAQVWSEVKYGHNGNPPIEELEKKYGTGWRQGALQHRKYGSNYVGVRLIIAKGVESLMEGGMGEWEACQLLDEKTEGRMQLLIKTLRDGGNPLTDIPKRTDCTCHES